MLFRSRGLVCVGREPVVVAAVDAYAGADSDLGSLDHSSVARGGPVAGVSGGENDCRDLAEDLAVTQVHQPAYAE